MIMENVPRQFVPPTTGEVIECEDIKYYIGKQIGK